MKNDASTHPVIVGVAVRQVFGSADPCVILLRHPECHGLPAGLVDRCPGFARAPEVRAMKVYISSTLDDLRPERDAIRDVLVRMECVVKESYKASESDLVDSIEADVAECEVYVV